MMYCFSFICYRVIKCVYYVRIIKIVWISYFKEVFFVFGVVVDDFRYIVL